MGNTSFDKIIDKVFDGFKKITPALVAIAIISGVVLFLPEAALVKLGLEGLNKTALSIIGTIFLLSCALILTILGSTFFQSTMSYIKRRKTLKNLKNKYLNLSVVQKRIIIEMMNSSSKSIELEYTSGDTLYLQQNDFIFLPQQMADIYSGQYIYAPHPWLIDLFQKEPKLFDTGTGKDDG